MDALTVDQTYELHNDTKKIGEALLFQAILIQAIDDFKDRRNSARVKFDALDWLINDSDHILQCSLSVCKIDHNRLLKWLVKDTWNLDL